VTYWFSRSCPSHEEGLDLLRGAAEAAGLEIDLEVVEVTGDDQAAELGFPGSPTYLVDGRDPFPREELGHAITADACRAYARPGGRIGPLPARDDLVAALREAAASPPRARPLSTAAGARRGMA
jgi:hypothetical protein